MSDSQFDATRPHDQGETQESAALPQDFESALAELESLVAQMESGEMDLEHSLKAYQRGVKLAKICQTRLQHVEQQVLVLQNELLTPFAEDAENTAGE